MRPILICNVVGERLVNDGTSALVAIVSGKEGRSRFSNERRACFAADGGGGCRGELEQVTVRRRGGSETVNGCAAVTKRGVGSGILA